MTQGELNQALYDVCGNDDIEETVDLLNRGADPNALVGGVYNSLHWAAAKNRLEIIKILLGRGAILDGFSSRGCSALLFALFCDHLEICLLLISRGADLRVVSDDNSSLADYGKNRSLAPLVKAQRVAELKAAFRAGCHPSQVQRRKDENWAKRWPLMNAATGSGFLLMAAKKAELKATAQPTDVALPPLPTATEEQRCTLRNSKVMGNIGLVRRIASFIPDKERDVSEGI